MVIQFAIIPTFLCPSFTILFFFSSIYSTFPCHFIPSVPAHPMPLILFLLLLEWHTWKGLYTNAIICHEVVVPQTLNVWVKKLRVNWRQLYKKDETTSTTDPSGRLKRHRKQHFAPLHFAGVWCFSGTHLFFIYIHNNASAAEKKARLNE